MTGRAARRTATAGAWRAGQTGATVDRLATIDRGRMRRLAKTAVRGARVRGVMGPATQDRRVSTADRAMVVVAAPMTRTIIGHPEEVGRRLSTTVQEMHVVRALMPGAASGAMRGRLMIGVMPGRLVMTGHRLGPADTRTHAPRAVMTGVVMAGVVMIDRDSPAESATLAPRAVMTGVVIARLVMIGRDRPAVSAMHAPRAAMTGVVMAGLVMIGRDGSADSAMHAPRAAMTGVMTGVTTGVTTGVQYRLTTGAMAVPVVRVGRRLDPDNGMVCGARAGTTAVLSGRPAMIGRRVRTAGSGTIEARAGMTVVPRLPKDAVTSGARIGSHPVPTVAALDRFEIIAPRGNPGGLSRIVSGAHRSAEI